MSAPAILTKEVSMHWHSLHGGVLIVSCDWCRGNVRDGCMMCVRAHKLAALVMSERLYKLYSGQAASGGNAQAVRLGDWLTNRVGTRCGLPFS